MQQIYKGGLSGSARKPEKNDQAHSSQYSLFWRNHIDKRCRASDIYTVYYTYNSANNIIFIQKYLGRLQIPSYP